MKTFALMIGISGLASMALAAEETVVEPRIESIGLFKNGLAVVRASFPVSGTGVYRWDRVPHVVHGSFWVESEGAVSVQSTQRMVAVHEENDAPTGRFQHDLVGREVIVALKRQAYAGPPIHGRLLDIPVRRPSRTWDTNYSSLNPSSNHWHRQMPMPQQHTPGFLVLETDEGIRRYIDPSEILSVQASGPVSPVERLVERPVLLFHVGEAPAGDARIQVSWLTKGLAWMPAYQLDLSDPARLTIRQSTVVRNESDDLVDAEIRLISGFPNISFGAVDSPIGPGATLASFFQQINAVGSRRGSQPHAALSQQMVVSNVSAPDAASFLPDLAEAGQASDDIHYESIGRHSLAAGDSLSTDIAAESAAYQRVVEWVVPDDRDDDGRYRRNDRDERDDSPWDAVRFANPFAFPMTTAPALVIEDGKFRGQSISTWVNPGQPASVRVTRALSVSTEASEIEEEEAREIVHIGGRRFRRTAVTGRLVVRNHRGRDATMSIRRDFSGKMIEAEGNPESTLRPAGVASVNERRRLEWNFDLPAGGEREITYRYQVLVYH